MKILHTEASSGWGGQEIRILTESQIFIKNGHQVMIAADIDSQLAKKASDFQVPIHPISLNKKSLKNLMSLRQLFKDLQPDVISCHSSTDHWLSSLGRLTLTKKPAIVRTRHISAPVTRNITTKWLYNIGTDALMTTGVSIKNALIEDNFVNPENVFSVPTGIDAERYQIGNFQQYRNELNLPNNHFIFGIVATLRSWKGHSYLIEAFGKLNLTNTSLLIVGDGPQMSSYQALAQSMPNAKNIHFAGNQSNVIPYLQAMDCFVLPSYANEGVPQALLQAMAVGLPIISCPIGGIPESLENYSNKVLVPPQKICHLSNAMHEQMRLNQKSSSVRTPFTPYTLDNLYIDALDAYQYSIKNRNNKINPKNV